MANASTAKSSLSDWDKDGISDEVEILIGSEMYLSDTDGDGISDRVEVDNIASPLDSDNDGLIDILDIDDDGDGIPTVLEGSVDSDEDGKPDYLDTDSDGDGLADGLEVRLTGNDADNDKVDDLFDVDITIGEDANGDGIDDHIALVDSNKDGVPDFLDDKSSLPHISGIKKRKKIASVHSTHSQDKETVSGETVLVSAVKLPTLVQPDMRSKRESKYQKKDKKKVVYGGSGYFYCANTGKIVNGIKGFMMTPPNKVELLRNATDGDYKWRTDEPGIYAVQFQIPSGMSLVKGFAKGRRVVKSADTRPLIMGGGENPAKRGFIIKSPANKSWYTSFDLKAGAPLIQNNNIALAGGSCNQ